MYAIGIFTMFIKEQYFPHLIEDKCYIFIQYLSNQAEFPQILSDSKAFSLYLTVNVRIFTSFVSLLLY